MTSEEVTAKRRAERKQFKLDRAQAMAAAAAEAEVAFAEGRELPSIISADGTRSIPSAATWKPSTQTQLDAPLIASIAIEADEEPLKDVEHLQLTLSEAFFLLWNLDCLSVYDGVTVRQCHGTIICLLNELLLQNAPMSLQQIWRNFQSVHSPPLTSNSNNFDNPFLINYVVYHHYRSLGWVIKGGIKFCADYLLYRRGPVFHHAECVDFTIL